ncbi:hypothetical protein [Streptomyces sp. CAU 1734]|uniref:hypothetical protein n=1 Tax=Streptomyces sp. CAU 1734 TaxID=3140360 RepID=UPI00326070E7
MARHKAPHPRRLPLRAGLTTAAAVAAGLGMAGTAHAAPAALPAAPIPLAGTDALGPVLTGPAEGVLGAVTNSVAGVGYLKDHQLNPLAKTGSDPLANGVGTQVADFKPISTELVTGPLARGGSIQDLPLIGSVAQSLPL